jgi:hypothetical protein
MITTFLFYDFHVKHLYNFPQSALLKIPSLHNPNFTVSPISINTFMDVSSIKGKVAVSFKYFKFESLVYSVG